MYYVCKRMEIAGAHRLMLPYESKCSNIHGHNWIVNIYCKSNKLTQYGMVIDFTHIKEHVQEQLDHTFINDRLPGINPTAENIAKWICDIVTDLCEVGCCYKVSIQESEGNIAIYERGSDE